MPTNTPVRILVVDDDAGVRALVTRILQEGGYEVVSLADGLAGVDAATTAAPQFDLVITNNCMPHLNGNEVVAEIRRHFPHQPILHLDDLSTPHRIGLPPDVPNLYKPFSIERLLEAVGRLLNEHP